MRRYQNWATCRVLFLSVALTLSSQAQGQVVERGRTLEDLIQSHPCASGLTNRIARVTDCDAADDVGDGGGAFQCWAICDGSAPWANLALGGGGAGTIGGTLTATDDLAVCTDGTGGSTIGACTVLNIDNLRLDGNTLSSTDTNGNIVLAPNGTGQVVIPSGITQTAPGLSFTGDSDTGFYRSSDGVFSAVTNTSVSAYFSFNGLGGVGTSTINGFRSLIAASTAGSGSPNALTSSLIQQVTTNEAATAENYNTLPTAVAGYTYTFVVQDADGIRITAAAGDTIRPIAGTAASAAGGFIRCATQGAFITLIAINATEWVAIGSAGVWTIDI